MPQNSLGWFPLYLDLWQGESVKCLSYKAQGLYMACLCSQFREGSIPSDLHKLTRVTGGDYEELCEAWPEIQDKFVEFESGRLINLRMDSIRREQESKSELFKSSGSSGAKKRWAAYRQANSPTNSPPIGEGNSPPIGEGNSPPNSIREDKSREEKKIPSESPPNPQRGPSVEERHGLQFAALDESWLVMASQSEDITTSRARPIQSPESSIQSPVISSDKPTRKRKQPAVEDWEPDWERFCQAYPKREGDLSKVKARAIFGRCVTNGVEASEIIAGAVRYKRFCDAKGSTGTSYVKQMPSFLNQVAWSESWEIQANNGAHKPTLSTTATPDEIERQNR